MERKVYQFIAKFQEAVLTIVSDSGASAIDKAKELLKDGRPYSLDLAGTFDFDDYGKIFKDSKPKVDSLEAMALMLKENGYKVSEKRVKVK